MATRAERFRYEQERSKPPRPPVLRKPRANVGTKQPRGIQNATLHERTGLKGDQRASVVIEETHAGARPTRKSTRTSANKQKASSTLDYVRMVKSGLASARHGRRSG